ncbi:type II secretion system protein XpsH [Lysobacter silvisoli]|uniref:Type II secretion system protein H n=1 Tax=Lysobacter silvisoli TaxID=2293254 RepID=A0A371JZQ6_9GAMM|nr:prepilin-type N-terminal cleavage/methylation domain-containing protein [Lysobacter silvisoli]
MSSTRHRPSVPAKGNGGSAARRAALRLGAGGRRARGFSLLEMLLVVALIAALGVLAAFAVSGGLSGMQLRSSAKELAAQLRYARTQAIATGRKQTFTIDPAAHTWSGADGRSGEIPQSLKVSFTGARQLQPNRGQGAIAFFNDGASTGGRIQVASQRAAWNVDVAWLTGEVKLRRVEARR